MAKLEIITMHEYRIMAYFSEVYPPRSYKGKVFTSIEEAQMLLNEAKEYYSSPSYRNRLEKLSIERRKVSRWREAKIN